MVDQVLPPKRDVALKLLEESSLFIHLDPRAEGVSVPPWFKKQPQLVLQVGLNMAVPIPDLEVTEKGISCTLSFSRQPHWCFMPWEAVFALVGDDGRGMVWPEDVPAEVARQSDLRGPAPKPAAKKRAPQVASLESAEEPEAEAPKQAGPPRLSVIPGGMSESVEPRVPAAAAVPSFEEAAPIEPAEGPAAPERQLALFEGGAPRPEESPAEEPEAEARPSTPPKRERPAWLRVVKGGATDESS
jgi:stringent starvation protein B